MARVDNTSSTIATLTKVGDVKPDGSTITIETNGTIHSVDQTPLATALVPGSVRPDGTTTTVSNGVLSAVMPTIDNALSDSSTNAVQNRVIKAALDDKPDSSDIPTKTSDLTNDSGFIDNGVSNLTNYYTKNDVGDFTQLLTTHKDSLVNAINDVAGSAGNGDMLKAVYDQNSNGIVDNAEKVNNHTVATDVPENAVFTDTVYDDTAIQAAIAAKPDMSDIPTKVSDLTNDAGYITSTPTKTSDLTNDSGFITNAVNNLVNYYLKTETYTQAEVRALISAAATGGFIVVQTLPTSDISITAIYLVPKETSQTSNIYDEYINPTGTASGWEKIGDTEINLSDYQTCDLVNPITVEGTPKTTVESALTAINTALSTYLKTSAFNTQIANYYTKTEIGDMTSLTTTDKTSIVAAINEVQSSAGSGDMKKSVYDTNNNGIVDNAEKVNNHTVAIDVPANAVFTDTVYDDTALQDTVANKVDKISGKGLSTNDYTTAEKDKLSGLVSDAQLPTGGTTGQVLKKKSGTNYDTEWSTVASITVDSALSSTSTNPVQNKVINSALNNKANTSALPTKVSDLTNDSGFITNSTTGLTNYYKKTETYTKTEVDGLIPAAITVDSAISTTSTNPVQNKIITEALNNKIQVTTTDPGEGSTLATGVLLVVLEESDT